MEEESSDPVVVAYDNATYTSDSLCDSMQELFEYVDNVTNSFDGDEKGRDADAGDKSVGFGNDFLHQTCARANVQDDAASMDEQEALDVDWVCISPHTPVRTHAFKLESDNLDTESTRAAFGVKENILTENLANVSAINQNIVKSDLFRTEHLSTAPEEHKVLLETGLSYEADNVTKNAKGTTSVPNTKFLNVPNYYHKTDVPDLSRSEHPSSISMYKVLDEVNETILEDQTKGGALDKCHVDGSFSSEPSKPKAEDIPLNNMDYKNTVANHLDGVMSKKHQFSSTYDKEAELVEHLHDDKKHVIDIPDDEFQSDLKSGQAGICSYPEVCADKVFDDGVLSANAFNRPQTSMKDVHKNTNKLDCEPVDEVESQKCDSFISAEDKDQTVIFKEAVFDDEETTETGNCKDRSLKDLKMGCDPAMCALETKKNPAICALETNKNLAICALMKNKNPANCALKTNKNHTISALETNKDPAICALETNKNPAICALETKKSHATCALKTNNDTALCPIQKGKDLTTATIEKDIELPHVIDERVSSPVDDKVTQIKLTINESDNTSHDTKSVFKCTKDDLCVTPKKKIDKRQEYDFLPVFQQSKENIHIGSVFPEERDQMTITKDHNATKKRHMSSMADIKTTPKRHKFGDPLSPIESAMSLRKERELIEVLEKTLTVYYDDDDDECQSDLKSGQTGICSYPEVCADKVFDDGVLSANAFNRPQTSMKDVHKNTNKLDCEPVDEVESQRCDSFLSAEDKDQTVETDIETTPKRHEFGDPLSPIESAMRLGKERGLTEVLEETLTVYYGTDVCDDDDRVPLSTKVDLCVTPKEKIDERQENAFLPVFQQSKEDMHIGSVFLEERDQMTIMKDHNATKKRHMSSMADIKTTPKWHKFGDPLSPIESAMSLRKDRGLIEVLEETLTVYYDGDDDECQSDLKSGQTGICSYPEVCADKVFDDGVLSANAFNRPQTSMKDVHKNTNKLDCEPVDEVESQRCDSFLSAEDKDQTVETDIETTPKRHEFGDPLSPIESAMRLGKERGLTEVLEETLTVYYGTDVCDDDDRVPLSTKVDLCVTPKEKIDERQENAFLPVFQQSKEDMHIGSVFLEERDQMTIMKDHNATKKRHMSSMADIKTTPKWHKFGDPLSPIESAMSLRKDRGLIEVLEETLTVYYDGDDDECQSDLKSGQTGICSYPEVCADKVFDDGVLSANAFNRPQTSMKDVHKNTNKLDCEPVDEVESQKCDSFLSAEDKDQTVQAVETDIKIMPKCHKFGDPLSPIKSAMRLGKERGLTEVLEETLTMYYGTDGCNDDDRVPLSTKVDLCVTPKEKIDERHENDFLPIFQQSKEDMHIGSVFLEERDQMTIMKDHNATKKRHMSSLANIETTPKRHKFGDPLSPIESAMSLRKDRGLIEVLEETLTVYYGTDVCDDDHRAPLSSTPLVPDHGNEKQSHAHENVRKVIWKVNYDEPLDNSMSHELLNNATENDGEIDARKESLFDYDKRNIVCKNNEVGGSLNDVYHKKDDMSAVFHDSQIFKQDGDDMDRTVTKNPPSLPNDTKDSNSVLPSIDENKPKSFNNTQVSITDSSYFAMNSSSKFEGRFKNTEATISNIDLDDVDILLSEDVLGLESGYDDSDVDDETLLAEEFDENERPASDIPHEDGICSNQESVVNRKVLLKEDTPMENKGSHSVKDAITEKLKTTDCDLPPDVDQQHLRTDKKENLADSNKTVDARIGCEKLEASTCSLATSLDIGKPELRVDENAEGDTAKHKRRTDSTSLLRQTNEIKNLETTQCKKSDKIEKSETEVVKTNVELQIAVKGTNRTCLLITKPNAETGSKDSNNNNINNLVSMKTTKVECDLNSTFLDRDKENNMMKSVMRKWRCDGIPSPDVNLTAATTYHKNYSKQNKTGKAPMALLEGEILSCLNFYEDEVKTTHHKMKHCTLTQATYKLRNQKHDLDNMNVMALEAFEQDCYNRCEFMRDRHRKEMEELKKRQTLEFNRIRNHKNIHPFVKEQQLMDIGFNHGQERCRLADHQRLEFKTLSGELQCRLQTEIEHYQDQVAPVEVLLSQVEKLKSENLQSEFVKKYGPTVMVPIRKRPGKENHLQQATVEICLPLMIAQALSHEEDVYNHFYKF